MYDARNEIIAIGEYCLHRFVELRVKELGIEDCWKERLAEFVRNKYPAHKANYDKLYQFLRDHDSSEIDINSYDATAITPLFLYNSDFKKMLDLGSDRTCKTFSNHIENLRDNRNALKHYPQDFTEAEARDLFFDQINALCNLASFAALAERYAPDGDVWREIILKAMQIEGRLQGEKWIILDKNKESVSLPDSDMSDMLFAAEEGYIDAQLKMGKAYYQGDRVKRDGGKAYMWFYKAISGGSIEARYYVGQCYEHGYGVDFDYEKAYKYYQEAAKNGNAAAQYQLSMLCFTRINATPEQKAWTFKWAKLSADQDYPEGVWMLGLCYAGGLGVAKDQQEYNRLAKKSAELGYSLASEELGHKAEKSGNYEEAMYWYHQAEKQGRNVQAVYGAHKGKCPHQNLDSICV